MRLRTFLSRGNDAATKLCFHYPRRSDSRVKTLIPMSGKIEGLEPNETETANKLSLCDAGPTALRLTL